MCIPSPMSARRYGFTTLRDGVLWKGRRLGRLQPAKLARDHLLDFHGIVARRRKFDMSTEVIIRPPVIGNAIFFQINNNESIISTKP